MTTTDATPTVFISYSHKNDAWKDRLRPHLGVLEQQGRIAVWDDRRINPGGEWYAEIFQLMARATLCRLQSQYDRAA